jgi:hypothetical protein
MAIAHRSPAWGNYLLRQAAGRYDFVVGHYGKRTFTPGLMPNLTNACSFGVRS